MKYKKYIFLFIVTLFFGINDIHAEECYYLTADKSTSVKYDSSAIYKFTIDAEDEKKLKWYDFKKEKFINKGTDKTDKDTGITVEAIPKDKCPEYLVYRHETKIFQSKGVWGFNDKSKADKFSNASNQLSTMKAWILSKKDENGNEITREQYNANLTRIENLGNTPIGSTNPNYTINGGGQDISVDCDSLFGSKSDPNSIRYLANEILKYPRIIVPALLIVMITVDIGKAVLAGKADEMTKAQKTALKRGIAAMLVFMVPWIVNVLMALADIAWQGLGYTTCGL